jgi:hypothetical protein
VLKVLYRYLYRSRGNKKEIQMKTKKPTTGVLLKKIIICESESESEKT